MTGLTSNITQHAQHSRRSTVRIANELTPPNSRAKSRHGKKGCCEIFRWGERPASRSPNTTTAREDARPTAKLKPSSFLDTRVVYCGDNLEQLAKLPDACVD